MSRVQAIERAFVVLGTLGDGPLGVTEAAARAGLPKSTVARLLAALVAAGAVERVPGGTDYRVGGRMVDPGRRRAADAQPRGGRATAPGGAGRGGGGGRRPVDPRRVPGPLRRPGRFARTRSACATGPARGCPCTPSRRAWSCWPTGPRRRSTRTSRGPLERFTPATVVEPAAVRERLRRVLLDGYAWTAEEVAEGITSVAAALADEDGEVVAAIHVHGPSYRFPADAERLGGHRGGGRGRRGPDRRPHPSGLMGRAGPPASGPRRARSN